MPLLSVWHLAAGAFGLTSIIMGAVAAHALADPHAASAVERASLYQIVHAAVLLVLASQTGFWTSLARITFMLGIVLFCGGIYLKYLAGQTWAGPYAPYGGMALMVGWLSVAFARA